jgi:hypothetical protein
MPEYYVQTEHDHVLLHPYLLACTEHYTADATNRSTEAWPGHRVYKGRVIQNELKMKSYKQCEITVASMTYLLRCNRNASL